LNIDIVNNIKAIELIKIEILQNVTNMFGDIISEPVDGMFDTIVCDAANVISLTYLLCRRLGLEYKTVNEKIKFEINKNIENQHNLERKFGDLSKLLEDLEF
jgi:hypothetical protein